MIETFLQTLGVLDAGDKVLLKSPLAPWIVLGSTVVIAGLVIFFYQRTTVPISKRARTLFITIKLLPLLLIAGMLLEPMLVTSKVTPQQGFLLVLLDDSKSMRIQDAPGSISRSEAIRQVLEEQGLLQALQDRFKVRTFHFDSDVERITDMAGLTADGEATNIAGALSQVAGEFRDMPLSGIVLISDGADNASLGSNNLAGVTAYLKSQDIPVYTLGVGQERIEKDIEILKVATSKTLTAGTVTDLFVTVRGHGYREQTVDLQIKEGARIVQTEQVRLGKDGETRRVKLSLAPDSPGIFEYSAEIQPKSTEMITENNQRRFLVDNRSRTARVLYVEGYPRKEFKFIRRAIEDDTQVRIVSMVRISHDGRLYRQGIQSAQELKDGYPSTREALFDYDTVIFGDIEASWFTPEQLQMTEAFVSIRGGGFLMLGGDHTFSQGEYGGTPIEDALPVRLRAAPGAGTWGIGPVDRNFQMGLTLDGQAHPLMRIAQDQKTSLQQWNMMPELTGYYRVGDAKPGATVLAIDPTMDLLEGSNVILAIQRYGQGRTMVFTSASSWRWQMLMSSDDQSHERFWQQMIRWLALSSPDQVALSLDKESYTAHEPVMITAHVLDATYEPVNNASVWAQVTGPTGQADAIELEWTVGAEGAYLAEYQPKLEGMHRVDISVRSPESIIAHDQGGFNVAESVAEYTDATLHADVLKRIATSTGGEYLTLEQSRGLPGLIPPVKQTSSMVQEEDLRDTTPLFAAIILLLGMEWFLRRQKGLA